MKKSNKKIFITVAVIVMIIATVVAIVLLSDDSSATQNLHMSIDAGVSYDLYVSPQNKIVNIEPIDDNSLDILNSIEKLSGLDYSVAIDKLTEEIVNNGYVSQNKNTVLLSIEKPYDETINIVNLSTTIYNTLGKQNIQGCVLTHYVTMSDLLNEMATTYNISFGKAKFINRIIKQDVRYSIEELTKLTINDLNIISISGDLQLENVDVIGTCDKSGFITSEDAINEAISNAKIWRDEAQSLLCSLIVENNRLVYNVLFVYDSFLYEYEIDAKSGAMLFFEKTTDINLLNESSIIEYQIEPAKEGNEAYELMLTAANHADIEFAHMTDYTETHAHLNGKQIHKITFNCDGYAYEYSLDIADNSILSYNKRIIRSNTGDSTFTITPNQNGFIGADNAALISFNHAGISYNDVINYYCRICKQRGVIYYELDFDAFSSIFSYLINAKTGEIIRYEKYKY